MQDMGDKLRMIVMAHRRIRLIGQMVLDEKELEAEEAALAQSQQAQSGSDTLNSLSTEKNGRRRRKRRVAVHYGNNGTVENGEGVTSSDHQSGGDVASSTSGGGESAATSLLEDPAEPEYEPVPVLMIETENVKPLKFQVDTEIKV